MPAWLIVLSVFLGLILIIGAIHEWGLRRMTIFEYQRGVKYSRGRFRQILEPGVHWFVPLLTSINRVDVRRRVLPITGQEVLTSDGISMKASMGATFELKDLNVAINQILDYEGALHLELQMALRELIGNAPVDEVLEKRPEFSRQLLELTREKARKLGLELHEVNIKDLMFPGALKQTFARIVEARKEGQAALEKARGETAALRNLANAAKMLEQNPVLLQLRMLHSIAGSAGNTLVLGLPPGSMPLPAGGPPAGEPESTGKSSRPKRQEKNRKEK